MKHQNIIIKLPNDKLVLLPYYKTETGQWVSVLENQDLIDLMALLNGEEPKQEYVELPTGEIPPWVNIL